jgi:PRMT5 oligomerisation domain
MISTDTGISIPCAYTSYLSPISSEKLHNEAKSFGDLQHFETPYVVKYHNANVLARMFSPFLSLPLSLSLLKEMSYDTWTPYVISHYIFLQ